MATKSQPFRLHSNAEDGFVVIHVHGSITGENAPALREVIVKTIEAGSTKIALAFADVDFIASAGIGMLVATLKKARTAHAELAICALRPELFELFELTRLNQVFTVAESVEAWKRAHA